jgi:hypothetical protein
LSAEWKMRRIGIIAFSTVALVAFAKVRRKAGKAGATI